MELETNTTGDTGAHARPENSTGERNLQRQRKFYISARLAELKGAVEDYAAEREQLTTTLKARAGEKGEEVKTLRHRREYVATRLDELRQEQQRLNLEKKTLAGTASKEP